MFGSFFGNNVHFSYNDPEIPTNFENNYQKFLYNFRNLDLKKSTNTFQKSNKKKQ